MLRLRTSPTRAAIALFALRHALLALLLLALAGPAFAQPETAPLTAQPLIEFALSAPEPMRMPTDVAVAPDESVYIADGVNDRVLRFLPSGRLRDELRHAGETPLQNPVALTIDPEGNAWITDNGNQRIVVFNPQNDFIRQITPPGKDHLPDYTGIAIDPRNNILWLADNDAHHLHRYDLPAQQHRIIGQFGRSLGQFHYPHLLDMADDGTLFVTDVLNGRIQRFDPQGRPAGSITTYGVNLGQVYRPKAVALDHQGRIFISDGTLNVIQAFSPTGRFLAVLRDTDGDVLYLQSPHGMDFDDAGNLYVVELAAARVRKFSLSWHPVAPPRNTTDNGPAATIGQQGRGCTICHFEWMQPLVDGQPTPIAPVPETSDEHPVVSRAFLCLSCHDTSVGDSRRRVWSEHGHQLGRPVPANYDIPDHLPLDNGTIACRTCHSAHSESTESIASSLAEVFFLRTDHPAQLCADCHGSMAGGVSAGMHPQGEMAVPIPNQIEQHAAVRLDDQIGCFSCHTSHGAHNARLLILPDDDNTLCLTCHTDLNPQVFSDAQRSMHGRLPHLTDQQEALVQTWQTRFGPNDELICQSCHMTHNAPHHEYLLAFDRAAEDTCAACHHEQRVVIDTPHDLRQNHPESTNILGQTPGQAGVCSSCHTAHRPGRNPIPSSYDPAGQCWNCHGPDQLAANAALDEPNHPESACNECHSIHDHRHRDFLLDDPAPLCARCHDDHAVAGGPHDLHRKTAAWPSVAAQTNDRCLACHRPHGSPQYGLFRAGFAQNTPRPDAVCTVCHEQAAPIPESQKQLLHPVRLQGDAQNQSLPTENVAGTNTMRCKTCHDPHIAGLQPPYMLRVKPNESAEEVCLDCHVKRNNIHHIGHAERWLRDAGFEVGSCKPCHVTHGKPEDVEPRYMWSHELSDFEPVNVENSVRNRYCDACHRADGPVPPPTIATHPVVEMFNPFLPDQEGYMPLYNDDGNIDPAGRIACQTCHLTHGRSEPLPIPAAVQGASSRELRARAWHVRSFGASNVCTTCHGFDALRRFIYFHDPQRRGGPIEGG